MSGSVATRPWKPAGWLDRGATRLQLIRQIALGNKSLAQLCHEYDVGNGTVEAFAKRHAAEIQAVVDESAAEFTALWIAEKRNRLAEYQQDIEDINESLLSDDVKQSEKTQLFRVKHAALRQVAEELGHLPGRVQIRFEGPRVTYQIVGVDMDKLGQPAAEQPKALRDVVDAEVVDAR